MPPAARITDTHSCPVHRGGPVETGEGTVIIGYQLAARKGDQAKCSPGTDTIAQGEPSVLIGYQDAARKGDPTEHGGKVAMGCPTVIIGSNPQTETLKTDKPFCEDCERKRKQREAEARRRS